MSLTLRHNWGIDSVTVLAKARGFTAVSPDTGDPTRLHADVAERLGATCLNAFDDENAGGAAGKTLVISDQTLQFLDEAGLAARLDAIARSGNQAIFLISTTFSQRLDEKGHNLHHSIHDEKWWLRTIRRYFPFALALPTVTDHLSLIVSWLPDSETLLTAFKKRQTAKKQLKTEGRRRRVRNSLILLQRPTLSGRQLAKEVEGRRIALVGNAQSLNERSYGAAIDAADTVIRCNLGPIIDVRTHGGRTDWLCTSLAPNEDDLRYRGIDRILWMSRRAKTPRQIPTWLIRSGQLYLYPWRYSRRLKDLIGAFPTTGAMAIDLLASWPIESLDLFGFDFSHSGSLSNLSDRPSSVHNFSLEQQYVEELANQDSRIQIHL